MDSLKTRFEDFLHLEENEGSAKAVSYIRALEVIEPLLRKQMEARGFTGDLYALNPSQLTELRDYVREQKRLGMEGRGDFVDVELSNYWKRNFCTSALSGLIRFAEARSVK